MKIGDFSLRENQISGPAAYMKPRGDKRLDEMATSETFQMFVQYAPTVEHAILTWLQTDYAAWKGEQELLSALR